MKIFKVLLTFSIIFSVSFLIESKLCAAENPFSLRISPTFHDVIATQTESKKEITTSITNLSKQELTINLSVLDIQQVPPEGKMQFLSQKNLTVHSLQPYISFPENTITLQPNETRKIIALLETEKMGPGGYYGGIIFQADNQEANKSSAVPAVSSLLFVAKEGDVKPVLRIVSVKELDSFFSFSQPEKLSIEFNNSGNIHLIPYGRVEVYDLFNRLVAKGILNESSVPILPTSSVSIDAKIMKVASYFPISLHKVIIFGQDANKLTGYTYEDSYLYINPIVLVTCIGFLLVLGFMWRAIFRTISSISKHIKGTLIIKRRIK